MMLAVAAGETRSGPARWNCAVNSNSVSGTSTECTKTRQKDGGATGPQPPCTVNPYCHSALIERLGQRPPRAEVDSHFPENVPKWLQKKAYSMWIAEARLS